MGPAVSSPEVVASRVQGVRLTLHWVIAMIVCLNNGIRAFVEMKKLEIALLTQSSLKSIFIPADYPSNTAVRFYRSSCSNWTAFVGKCLANATDLEIACAITGLRASTIHYCLAQSCLLPEGDCGPSLQVFFLTAPEGKVWFIFKSLSTALTSFFLFLFSACIDKHFRWISGIIGCDCHSPSKFSSRIIYS